MRLRASFAQSPKVLPNIKRNGTETKRTYCLKTLYEILGIRRTATPEPETGSMFRPSLQWNWVTK